MEYCIIRSQGMGVDFLISLVNGRLADGWLPIGGVSMTTDQGRNDYAQALIRNI